MREKWARLIVIFTGMLVLLLTVVFARIQNPITPADRKEGPATGHIRPATTDSKLIERGRQIYREQHCAQCHSIAGQGNPRIPLDAIGDKHNATELRDWIIGSDAIQGKMPEGVRKLKEIYRTLPEDDLNALVIYLQSPQ